MQPDINLAFLRTILRGLIPITIVCAMISILFGCSKKVVRLEGTGFESMDSCKCTYDARQYTAVGHKTLAEIFELLEMCAAEKTIEEMKYIDYQP